MHFIAYVYMSMCLHIHVYIYICMGVDLSTKYRQIKAGKLIYIYVYTSIGIHKDMYTYAYTCINALNCCALQAGFMCST
jgi:hypothetical protein